MRSGQVCPRGPEGVERARPPSNRTETRAEQGPGPHSGSVTGFRLTFQPQDITQYGFKVQTISSESLLDALDFPETVLLRRKWRKPTESCEPKDLWFNFSKPCRGPFSFPAARLTPTVGRTKMTGLPRYFRGSSFCEGKRNPSILVLEFPRPGADLVPPVDFISPLKRQ